MRLRSYIFSLGRALSFKPLLKKKVKDFKTKNEYGLIYLVPIFSNITKRCHFLQEMIIRSFNLKLLYILFVTLLLDLVGLHFLQYSILSSSKIFPKCILLYKRCIFLRVQIR